MKVKKKIKFYEFQCDMVIQTAEILSDKLLKGLIIICNLVHLAVLP